MPTSKCPNGQIRRRGYTAKRGSKKISVKSTCIKDRGSKGKGPKTLPVLREEVSLSRHGYSAKATKERRHTALRKAARTHGTLKVLRRLNLIRNYSSWNKENYDKMSEDVKYLSEYYEKEKVRLNRRKGSSKSKRSSRKSRKESRRKNSKKSKKRSSGRKEIRPR